MRVLVACEFSGTVRDAFRRKGHEAWSCDLLPTEGNPEFNEFHYQTGAIEVLGKAWDLIISHPPCTYLTLAGNKWFKEEYKKRFPDRQSQRESAIEFFMEFVNCDCDKICIENPIGTINTAYRKPDQIIQPYQFDHTDRKPTCLWLKGLPKLVPTEIVEPVIVKNRNGKTASAHHDAALRLPALERMKVRSKTYQGIADAMADQWGNL